MIVRSGNRTATDYGPAPAGVDGMDSANAMALRAEVFEAPVTRRHITPEERARLVDEAPVRVIAVQTRVQRTEAQQRESSRRGAAATAARYRRPVLGRPPRAENDAVFAAIRAASGRQSEAARSLGYNARAFNRRVNRLRASGRVPDDVTVLLPARRAA